MRCTAKTTTRQVGRKLYSRKAIEKSEQVATSSKSDRSLLAKETSPVVRGKQLKTISSESN